MPVNCIRTGTRRGGNQAGTSRSAARKVNASPLPTSTRPSTAGPTSSVTARTICPLDHQQRADGDHEPRTEPVQQHSSGNLHAGVDDDLQHDEAGQHRRFHLEPVRRLQSGHAERCALAAPRRCRRRRPPTTPATRDSWIPVGSCTDEPIQTCRCESAHCRDGHLDRIQHRGSGVLRRDRGTIQRPKTPRPGDTARGRITAGERNGGAVRRGSAADRLDAGRPQGARSAA